MRVGGLASGMDTDSLVKQLMQAQKMPLDKLMQKKVWTEWQQESFRDFNLSLSSLRTSASSMRLQSTFNAYSATSSNTSIMTATATANAVSGTYTAEVVTVASSAKLHSANAIEKAPNAVAQSTDKIGVAGLIKVTGTATVNVEITADMSYADVAKKLQDSTAGKIPELRVSFDDTTSRFFISTKGMGTDQNFSLEFTDGTLLNPGTNPNPALANQIINNSNATTITTKVSKVVDDTMSYITAATNGSIKFDGIDITGLTSNKTTVNGLVLNLTQGVGTTTITIGSDSAKPLETIKSFVEKYNETIADIEKQLVEKRYPNFQPLSDEQKKDMSENEIELWEEKARSGLVRNDPTLKNAMQELRRAFMDPVEEIADGNINLLSQIGINTGNYMEGGKLFIDEAKLNAALTNKPDEVMQLFTYKDAAGNGVGIGDKVYQKLNDIVKNLSTQAGNPGNSVDNSTLSKKIKQMNDEITRWQDRLTGIEDRYWRQFTAMEKALSQMNSQSAWMQQNMFGGM